MAKKRKKIRTKAERDAWNAHVDESIAWARTLVERGLDDLRRRGTPLVLNEIRAQKGRQAS